MKKLFTVLFLLASLVAMSCLPAFAQVELPPADQISDNPNEASVEWRDKTRSDEFKITYTYASISKASSTSVYVSATTEANSTATVIGGTMYIQQWKDNKWNSYKTLNFINYDSYTSSYSDTVTVDSNYSYRLVVSHSAFKAGDSSYAKSTTTSVKVP